MALGGGIAILGLLLVVVAVVGIALEHRRDAVRRLTPGDGPTDRLLAAWLGRARRWRTVGGVTAAFAASLLSLTSRNAVTIGIGWGRPWHDPLLVGLLASFAGAIGAELHRLRHPSTGTRTASITPREPGRYAPYSPPARRGTLIGLAVVTIVAGTVVALAPGTSVIPWPGYALAALAVLAAARAMQRVIALRGRPALPDNLQAADDLVRRLAITSIDTASAGIALLLVAWQVSDVLDAAWPDAPGPADVAIGLALIAALVVAVVWWWRGAPHRLLARHRPPTPDLTWPRPGPWSDR